MAPEEVSTANEVSATRVENGAVEVSENPVMDTIAKLAENVAMVTNELEPSTEIALSMCAVSVGEVERMLLEFADSIDKALPDIREILNIGEKLASAQTKDQARLAAHILELLESVLEAIVPFQVVNISPF